MQVKTKSVRILKVLGKAVLGLLIFLLGLLLLLHVSFIQRYITQKIPGYLSDRIGAKVELQKIGFSILGYAEIQGLKVWDPQDEMILSLDTLNLELDFLEILFGDLLLKKVSLNGVYGRLTQQPNKKLNIQFILDAFSGREKSDTSGTQNHLQCDILILEDVDFAFESLSNAVIVSVKVERLKSHNIHISPDPVLISIDSVWLDRNVVDIFIPKSIENESNVLVRDESEPLNFDIDLNFGISVNSLKISDNGFSLHKNEVIQTPKFDLDHISVDRGQLEASNILLHLDTLNFDLLELSAQLPGFELDKGSAEVIMNHNQFGISNLALYANETNVKAELQLEYKSEEQVKPHLSLESKGQLDLEEIFYFLPDTLEPLIGQWSDTKFSIDVNSLSPGKESVDIELQTLNSHVELSGNVSDILEPDKLAWENLIVQSSIGTDIKTLLKGMIGEFDLPPDKIDVQMTTSGNRRNIFVDGAIVTKWGNVDVVGGLVPGDSGIGLDLKLSSKNLLLNEYLDSTWLGPADLSFMAKGSLGNTQDLQIEGLISRIEILGNVIQQIAVEGHLIQDSIIVTLAISDSNYRSQIYLDGELGSPMRFSSFLQLDEFMVGDILSADSTLKVSGNFNANITIADSNLQAHIDGNDLRVFNSDYNYSLDTLVGSVSLSPDSSSVYYGARDAHMELASNFDLREIEEVLNAISSQILYGKEYSFSTKRSRELSFKADLDEPGLLLLSGMPIDSFSSVQIEGSWKETDRMVNLNANTGILSAFGISYDTLDAHFDMSGVNINSNIVSDNLLFKTLELGDLNFDLVSETDTSQSSLRLIYDSINVLSLDTRILINDEGVAIFPDELIVYDQIYEVNSNSPLFFNKESIVLSDLNIIRDDMEITLDGDLNKFNLEFANLNLKYLDPILFPDSTVINSGSFNGEISFIKDQHLDLVANIDSLVLLNSIPISINLQAETNEDDVPFEFLLSNGGSDVNIKGTYGLVKKELDASLLMDIDSLEMFRIFYEGYLQDVRGAIKGEAKIQGSLQNPFFDGYMQFSNFDFSTKNPKLSFNVKDDKLQFSNEGLALNDFVIFDNLNNQLHVSGGITNDDYKSLSYDLNIKTDQYALINRPESENDNLSGLLVLGTDINLKGNEKDTYVTADILVKDTTALVLTLADKQNQLINTEGVIEFVDPSMLLDSSIQIANESAYDSIIAGLPDFTLTSKILIEEKAGLTIHVDPQSGDYFKVSGKAELDLTYDRTGNPMLNGTYVATDGVYSLSFYDLVKKDFNLVKGSSITWAGGPEEGALDIKAVYTIQSNSIGLVGHEVGESEKSAYKKSLNYEVGINIKGTIDKPDINFSLDLPPDDKITYPVLSNKLDRLKLPEFQSDLNKQVFGLLVLGGFLPETTGEDANQNQVASTALFNSVNSVLAGQLNRFASQYIKGVNIDVGIQSYSDYASNGGKTKTAMDFHVSKSIMDDRLVFEIGGDFDISADQSGANKGNAYRGDMAIIYDLTGNGDKQLKLFNNESYDIIYQEIRNTGISLIFIREFDKGERKGKNK